MPTPAQKLASQLGDVWVVQAYPLVSGSFEIGEKAHAQGLYSGLGYFASGAVAVSPLPLFDRYYRNQRVLAGAG